MPAFEETLLIGNGIVEAVIVPRLGAGLQRFDYVGGGRREAIFRSPSTKVGRPGLELAMFLLVPFSNRVSGGGFWFDESFVALEPNVVGERYPIHGDAFSQPWEVVEATGTSATLRLLSHLVSPFHYAAVIEYLVVGETMTARLSVENRGDARLPFGTGFHPWIVRTPQVQLHAAASAVWMEDENHLRSGSTPVRLPPTWDFKQSTELPSGFINNAFAGWSGKASVRWPDRKLELEIAASNILSTYVVYSPSSAAEFFCFEPVSHPVDAFNLPGNSAANGLVVLAPGEDTVVWASFSARLSR